MKVKNHIPNIAITVLLLVVSVSYAKEKLARRYEGFELGKQYDELEPWLKIFKCENIRSTAGECILQGYPKRDDILLLKFYRGELVAIAHFTFGMNYEQRLAELQKRFGKPSMPAYISDKVVSNIWKDEKTYVTLTNLVDIGCVVYEIRDIHKEPLYRQARKNLSP